MLGDGERRPGRPAGHPAHRPDQSTRSNRRDGLLRDARPVGTPGATRCGSRDPESRQGRTGRDARTGVDHGQSRRRRGSVRRAPGRRVRRSNRLHAQGADRLRGRVFVLCHPADQGPASKPSRTRCGARGVPRGRRRLQGDRAHGRPSRIVRSGSGAKDESPRSRPTARRRRRQSRHPVPAQFNRADGLPVRTRRPRRRLRRDRAPRPLAAAACERRDAAGHATAISVGSLSSPRRPSPDDDATRLDRNRRHRGFSRGDRCRVSGAGHLPERLPADARTRLSVFAAPGHGGRTPSRPCGARHGPGESRRTPSDRPRPRRPVPHRTGRIRSKGSDAGLGIGRGHRQLPAGTAVGDQVAKSVAVGAAVRPFRDADGGAGSSARSDVNRAGQPVVAPGTAEAPRR